MILKEVKTNELQNIFFHAISKALGNLTELNYINDSTRKKIEDILYEEIKWDVKQ